jgi:hypothetical protein
MMPDSATGSGDQIQREIAEALRSLATSQRLGSVGVSGQIGPNGWPITDPSKLTTDAVDRSTDNWRRELAAAVAILETRLAAMDTATQLNAERIDRIRPDADAALAHVRSDVDRQVAGLRELIHGLRELQGERIDGMDKATKLLAEEMGRVPSDIDRGLRAQREILEGNIHNVEAVAMEKFTAIEGTFASNALALAAALAAQKEAAAETNKSNTLAIDRANSATKETIAANAAQTTSSIASQAATIDDIKQRVVRIESGGLATTAAHHDKQADDSYSQAARIAQASQAAAAVAAQRATISLFIAGIVGLVGIISALFAVFHG